MLLSVATQRSSQAAEIRDLTLQEADVAGRFFHERWRPDHIFYRNRELLLWQYRNNPYASQFSNGLTFKAALEADKAIGVFAYMPFRFNFYGEKRFGCHLSAWWVDPAHRRGPLGLRLLHSLQEASGLDACISGINTDIAEKLYERLSWVIVRNIPRLLFVVDPEKFKALMDPMDSTRAVAMPMLGSALRKTTTGIDLRHKIEIERLTSFDLLADSGWDEFYWRKIAPTHIGPAREAIYLNWRYREIPIFNYGALLARESGEIAGLLVYRVEQVKGLDERIVRIVDIAALPEAIPDLVDTVVQLAKKQEASCIDFFCTYSGYTDQLTGLGFIDARDATGARYWFPHLFQPLDHARMRLNSAWWVRNLDLTTSAARADFCIMKGDYEFDRPN